MLLCLSWLQLPEVLSCEDKNIYMSTKHTVEQKAEFVHLRATGHSYSRCSKQLGIARVVLLAWGAELAECVNAERACELQAIIEQAGITRAHRVTMLAALTKQAFEALSAKAPELESLPLPQLAALALSLERRLQAEGEPVSWGLSFEAASSQWRLPSSYEQVIID